MVYEVSSSNMSSGLKHVPLLDGSNYEEWKENILLALGCMDMDLALRVGEPAQPTDESPKAEKSAYEKWERSNRLSLMYVKAHICKSIRGSIPECDNVEDYLKSIEEQFVTSDKAKASTLMNKLSTMKLDQSKDVRAHIMSMRDIATQLNNVGIEIYDSFLVHFILNSLPKDYGPFKISYNTQKENWTVNQLLNMCVTEEGRLKNEGIESAHFVSHKKQSAKGGKSNYSNKWKKYDKVSFNKTENSTKCFFCKKQGHMKQDCLKYKAWLEKKGLSQPKENNGK